jgi:hypothetical protein
MLRIGCMLSLQTAVKSLALPDSPTRRERDQSYITHDFEVECCRSKCDRIARPSGDSVSDMVDPPDSAFSSGFPRHSQIQVIHSKQRPTVFPPPRTMHGY